jgi:hypothetical protein
VGSAINCTQILLNLMAMPSNSGFFEHMILDLFHVSML